MLLWAHILCKAQSNNPAYAEYVKQYSAMAVAQEEKHGVPASITLAQGLLESGAGRSELARKSNNHFGIKCNTEWRGGKVYFDDDAKNECFRKYNSVGDSYEDHSLFLAGRPRYANLFNLNPKDYRGWAKGLQQSGYATDPAYANRLIKLIEDYQLYRYDGGKAAMKEAKAEKSAVKKKAKKEKQPPFIVKRPVQNTGGLDYIYAVDDDNFGRLVEDTGLTVDEIMLFNEMPEDFPLRKGDIIYLEKKKTKAAKPDYDHVVQIGESMHSISQKYGMRVKNLYKLNKKSEEYVPVEGDVLRLR
ncbi:MAG: glucosaminidase domain-containing protein [Tannerellaceae bacterium]|jgi:hypothetical protein|nr:glucosaminidase domain-containing protein [Tannerellaceae bacterium]